MLLACRLCVTSGFGRPEDKPVGLQLVRFSVSICVLLATARLFTVPLHLTVPEWPSAGWAAMWYGPDRYGTERAQIEASLESLPGKQLVLVEASDSRNALDQWVYNNPDFDHSKVVWANDMSAADNLRIDSVLSGTARSGSSSWTHVPATVSPVPRASSWPLTQSEQLPISGVGIPD